MSLPKRCLVVDDSRLVVSLHSNILRKLGWECGAAENGAVALEMCLKTHYDLVLTDINMPKMDGYVFTEKLRATPGYAETPIIMVSTEEEAQDRTRGIEAGANVYVVKPLDADDLGMHVRMLLGA